MLAAEVSCGQVAGALTPAFLKALGVVPDRRLVAGLEDEAVDLGVERREPDPRRREVRQQRLRRVADRLQRALVDELLDEARLRDVRHVRRLAARDGGREHGRKVVADRLVGDLHVRVHLVERLDHVPEGRCLGTGPDAVEGDAARHGARLRRRARATARGDERGKCDDGRTRGDIPSQTRCHDAAPFA